MVVRLQPQRLVSRTTVNPNFIDLTDHLTTGEHMVHVEILNMRPKDEKGNFGFWRVSCCLIGWEEYPPLWMN